MCSQPFTRPPLPMRDGVNASVVFLPIDSQASTIYQFLCDTFSHISPLTWQQRFEAGLVSDSSGRPLSVDSLYRPATRIYYYRELAQETMIPFEHHVIYENEHLLVVDKPHFLTVSPTGRYVQQTLLTRLNQQYGYPELSPIHRLDRETAGVILFAKQAKVRAAYQQLFARHQVYKIYHAIAPYTDQHCWPQRIALRLEKGQPFYTMRVVEGEINSITEIDLMTHNEVWAKYRLCPLTGKQHQLRVHMANLGIAIKNDRFYLHTFDIHSHDDFNHPLQLVAKHVQFVDPMDHTLHRFSSSFDVEPPDR